jgi:prepilin-type N-terminal cleavage/methylation domain-containing protein
MIFSRKQGFTVLELLVVIAMITILLGIVMVSFSRAKRNVNDDGKVSQFKLLQLSLEQYHTQCKVYPRDLDPTTDNAYPIQGGAQPCTPFGEFLSPSISLPLFQYTALGSSVAQPGSGYCSTYHLSVQLENVNARNDALSADTDFTGSSDLSPCASGPNHVDADDTQGFYDIRYP